MAATDRTHDKMNCFISNIYYGLFISCSCLFCTPPLTFFVRLGVFAHSSAKLLNK